MPEIYRPASFSSMSASRGRVYIGRKPGGTAMMNRRQMMAAAAAASAAWPLAHMERAAAQLAGNAFIVSGFPAGGMGDLLSRPLSEKLRGSYAANVLVDHRVGAGGRLAAEFVKRANPDGLTILQIPASIMTLYPHTYKSLELRSADRFHPGEHDCAPTCTPSPPAPPCPRRSAPSPISSPGRARTRSNRPTASRRRARRCILPA